MRDPDEGVDVDGFIVTGVRRDRAPRRYEPILTEAADAIATAAAGTFEGLYLYGSVATGQARPPGSDVDLLALVRHGRTPGRSTRFPAFLLKTTAPRSSG